MSEGFDVTANDWNAAMEAKPGSMGGVRWLTPEEALRLHKAGERLGTQPVEPSTVDDIRELFAKFARTPLRVTSGYRTAGEAEGLARATPRSPSKHLSN